MADEDKSEDNPKEKKKSKGKLIGIVVAVVLVLGAAAGGAVAGGKFLASPPPAAPTPEKEAKPAEEPISATAKMTPVVVDLRDDSGGTRHLKLVISFELADGVTEEDFKRYAPRGRQAVIRYLRAQKYEKVTDPKHFEKSARGADQAIRRSRSARNASAAPSLRISCPSEFDRGVAEAAVVDQAQMNDSLHPGTMQDRQPSRSQPDKSSLRRVDLTGKERHLREALQAMAQVGAAFSRAARRTLPFLIRRRARLAPAIRGHWRCAWARGSCGGSAFRGPFGGRRGPRLGSPGAERAGAGDSPGGRPRWVAVKGRRRRSTAS